jgi:hypothetical protein
MTADLDRAIAEFIAEVKKAHAVHGTEPCGGYVFAQAQINRSVAKVGEGSKVINPRAFAEWGCNPNPKDGQLEGPIGTRQFTEKDGDTETTTTYEFMGFLNFDKHDETRIEGSVRTQKGRPVKGAEIKARDTRRGKTYPAVKTDKNGRYEIKVRSGPPYEVTAEKNSCSAQPATLDVCGWGKTTPDPKDWIRQESFTQDFQMECRDLKLRIEGKAGTQFAGAVGGGVMQGGTTMARSGEIPLTLDEDTGKITGDAMISSSLDTGHLNLQTDDGGGGEGGIDQAYQMTYRVQVAGHLEDGQAKMRVLFYPVDGSSGTVTNQVWDADQQRYTMQTVQSAAPDSTDLESEESLEILWTAGESVTQRQEFPVPMGSGKTYQEYTFTLLEDGTPRQTRPPAGAAGTDPHFRPAPGPGSSGSGSGPAGGPSGSYASGPQPCGSADPTDISAMMEESRAAMAQAQAEYAQAEAELDAEIASADDPETAALLRQQKQILAQARAQIQQQDE